MARTGPSVAAGATGEEVPVRALLRKGCVLGKAVIRISRARRRARCSGYRGRATPSTLVRAESAGPPGPVGGVVVSSLGMSASGSSPEEAPAGGESLERQLSRGTVEKQYTKKELGRPLCKNLIHLNQLMVVHLVFMGTSILAPCHYIAVHT
eukprot:COSAG06_NODE_29561_length_554_cov_0.969231_1_plen_151_part_10